MKWLNDHPEALLFIAAILTITLVKVAVYWYPDAGKVF